MSIIITQLYIIATSLLVITQTGIIRKAKWWVYGHRTGTDTAWFQRRLKPFDCPLCMTFWVSLIVQGYSLPLPEAIGIASISALVASQLEKYLVK